MKKIISFLLIAAGLMISAQTKAENTVSLTIGETVTEYATLEDAVSAAETASEGIIRLLPAYNRYPQAWMTDLTGVEEPTGFETNKKGLYTFHAFDPEGDNVIFDKVKGKQSLTPEEESRAKQVVREINPDLATVPDELIDLSQEFKFMGGYADWTSDFEVFFDTDIDSADYTLAGNYGDWGWYPNDDYASLSVDLKAYDCIALLNNAFLPKPENNLHYWELMTTVNHFHCGIISKNDTLNAGKTFFVNLFLYYPGNKDIKILMNAVRYAFPALVDEQYNVDVDPAVIEGKSEEEVVVVEKLMNSSFAEGGNNVDEATAGYGEENDKFIEVKLDAAEVTILGDSANAVTTSVFDVKPMMTVISGEDTTYQVIPNKEISSPITFRLPVDEALIGQDVKVSHKGESDPEFVEIGTKFVESELRKDETISGAYVELSSKEFSLFKIEYKAPAALFEAKAAMTAKKAMVNGQLVIVKDGKMYNAQGVAL